MVNEDRELQNVDFNQHSDGLFDGARASALTLRSELRHTGASIMQSEEIMTRTKPDSAFKNKSVIRAFAILKSFQSSEEWVAASDLSRRSHIHEATVNRFMQSLTDVGAVVRNQAGHYRCMLFVMPGAHPNSLGAQRQASQPRDYRTVPG